MNSEVKNIVRKLYIDKGEPVFKDSRVLKAYIADILAAYPSIMAQIYTAIDEGIPESIINEINPQGNLSRANLYVEQLVNIRGMKSEIAKEIVNIFLYAIWGVTIVFSNDENDKSKDECVATSYNGKIPSFVSSSDIGNNKFEPVKKKDSKKGIFFGMCAAIIGFIILFNVFNSSGDKNGTLTHNDAASSPYVVNTQLTNISSVFMDKNIKTSNNSITTNVGTECNGYIMSSCPSAEISYNLNGNYDILNAIWSLSTEGKNTEYKHSVEILADGVSIYKSPNLTAGDVPINVNVNLNYCDTLTIVFHSVKEHAFLGDIQVMSSQTDREYNNSNTAKSRTYQWLASMDDMGEDKMIIWKDTWIETNTGSYLVCPINPYVPSYDNVDIIEFKENGSYIDYYLGGEYSKLSGTCAVDKHNGTLGGNMQIQLIADSSVIYTSPTMSDSSLPSDFVVDISGCSKLRIKFIPSGNGKWGYDAADFSIGNLKVYK